MAITTERLLTSPRGFGLTTASPVQRAICRVADGVPLGELAEDPTVVRVLGGPEALAHVPLTPPTEFYVIAAIRCGKSLFAACLATRIALTIDLSFLKPHEIARVVVVSVDKDKAGAVMEHLMGAFTNEEGALKAHLLPVPKPTTESLYIRRDDGRIVRIMVVAGSVGGRSLVSRWLVAAIFDEAARMVGIEDGAVNLDDMRKSIIARLRLIKGQLIGVTSPWIAHGPIYDVVERFWGAPSHALTVVRATGPEMNPVLWTPEACEAERLSPDGAYETDVLGEFADPEGGYLTAGAVRAATRAKPETLSYEKALSYTAAMDPGVTGNAWTLVVVAKKSADTGQEADDRFFVAFTRQWQGAPAAPLKAREVFEAMAKDLERFKVSEVYSDRYGGHLLAEHAQAYGLKVHVSTDTPEEIAQRHQAFRTRMLDGKIELAPVPALAADLLSKRKKRMPNGSVRYVAPVSRDGRHADYADSVILAVQRAADAPSWIEAMGRARQEGWLR